MWSACAIDVSRMFFSFFSVLKCIFLHVREVTCTLRATYRTQMYTHSFGFSSSLCAPSLNRLPSNDKMPPSPPGKSLFGFCGSAGQAAFTVVHLLLMAPAYNTSNGQPAQSREYAASSSDNRIRFFFLQLTVCKFDDVIPCTTINRTINNNKIDTKSLRFSILTAGLAERCSCLCVEASKRIY